MGRRARVEYTADFETTTDPDDCRVWAWGVAVVGQPDTFVYGTDIDTFLAYMDEHPGRYWFHNLRFDGAFVMVRLLETGYAHTCERPRGKQFSALIDGLGKVYRIQIGPSITLADSLKKITMSVADVASTYHLPYGKGDIDYDAPRPVGHELTPEELDYLCRDVCIMALAMAERLSVGTRLTTSSDTLAAYKDLIGEAWDGLFPVLNGKLDALLRGAYRGGWVYVAPEHRGREVGEGVRLDVNSLYPWALATRPLPVGTPRYFRGAPPAGELWVARAVITARLRPDGVPCIPVREAALYGSAEYGELTEPTEMDFCSVDFELWREMYEIDVETWEYGFSFDSADGLFTDYINHYMEIKARSTGGERFQAKLFLNSLYGKFGQKIDVSGKVPVLDDERVLHYVAAPKRDRDPVYLPVAIFTCAHARGKTIRAARLFGHRFCYADTDSIHAIGRDIPEGIEVHPSKLGAFKCEAYFERARFVRPKTYVEIEEGGNADYKCAGMSDGLKSIMRFEDFREGFRTPECDVSRETCSHDCAHCYANKALWGLRPRNVPGGVVLVPSPFSIK